MGINLTYLLRIVVVCCVVAGAISYFKKGDLHSVGELLPALAQEPKQSPAVEDSFIFEYRGREYHIDPKAEYELWGLVVTHNNIHSFADIYHDSDSVDIKDICVIWGRNAENDAFKEVEFWSDPWTCWTRRKRGQGVGFESRDLSNNHLLSDSPRVRDVIQSIRIGDQIYMSGTLVDYSEPARSSFVRATSLDREDEGNGACEVLFVDEAKVLKPAPAFWYAVYDWSIRIGLFTLLLMLLRFLREAYKPMLKPLPTVSRTSDETSGSE